MTTTETVPLTAAEAFQIAITIAEAVEKEFGALPGVAARVIVSRLREELRRRDL